MRALRCTHRIFALALALAPSLAAAQSGVEFVSRTGGASTAAGPVGARDCPTERWTFRLSLAGAHPGDPEVWLSRGDACARTGGDATCVRAPATTFTRVTERCEGATCWQFSIASRWLVDPLTGACPAGAGGSTRIFAWADGAGVASPRVDWDTLRPADPTSVSAMYGSESEVRVAWSYPIATEAAADASTDAADAGDADDVTDASDVTDVTDVADVTDVTDAATDAPAAPTYEPVRRFWVLCDPVADGALDAGSSCPAGAGFAGLDVDSDESLARFADQCGVADGGVASTATAQTFTSLPLGRRYRFAVVAEDRAGNRSAAVRAAQCTSAQAYTDFWEHYRATGGEAPAGCSASPGARAVPWSVIALLAALSAAAARGRRSRG